MTQTSNISKREAVEALWRKGVLIWKLDSSQKQFYRIFKDTKAQKVVLNCSRQIGKSYTLCVIAVEQCISNPNTIVKYAAPTKGMVRKIIKPTLRKLFEDCPKDLKPEYNSHENVYRFANGSELHVEGVENGNGENLRGSASHLNIVDEAGFISDLDYIVNDVMLPMTLTTKGRIMIASTPPKTPGHDFIKYIREAQFHGTYLKKTILEYIEDVKNDPPHFKDRVTQEMVDIIKESSGGQNSDTWRREYMCEILIDQQAAIIPEFNDTLETKIVKEWPRPPRYDSYTSLDLGYRDLHGALFAYYDFRTAKLIIEDEYLIAGRLTNSQSLARDIRAIEEKQWKDPYGTFKEPYIRIADDDMLTLNDLSTLHGIHFLPTRKDNKDAAINELRIKLGNENIIINPRCKNLIHHLKTGVWDKSRKSFARSPDAGHFDLIDALIYLVRNVQWSKNPYPAGWDLPGTGVFKPMNSVALSDTHQAIKGIFVKKR